MQPQLTIDIGRRTVYGNPVIIGQKCPICSSTHSSAGDTIPCYKKYLWHHIKTHPHFLKQLQLLNSHLQEQPTLRLWCPGCGINSPTCHGRALETALAYITSPQFKGAP